MKAVIMTEFGSFEVLRYADVETPTAGPGQVLVKVLASGINRLEHYLREGTVLPQLAWPHILGSDAAGEVAALGAGVTQFKVGQRVIPMPGFPLVESEESVEPMMIDPTYAIAGIARWGTYAEYVLVPAPYLLPDQTGLPPEEVATLPMTLVTGVQAVKVRGQVKAGDYVLIHAGASGTGSMNIQIAKALGARVATTIVDEDVRQFVESIGANLIINTNEEDFVARVHEWTGGQGADVVIDNLGGDVIAKSIEALRPRGILVAMGFMAGTEVHFNIRSFFFAQKEIRGTLMGTQEDMRWGLEQVRLGTIKPQLDQILPLSQAAEAHRLIAANLVKGNIVLQP